MGRRTVAPDGFASAAFSAGSKKVSDKDNAALDACDAAQRHRFCRICMIANRLLFC